MGRDAYGSPSDTRLGKREAITTVLRRTVKMMRPEILLAAALAAAPPLRAEASEFPKRWTCDGGLTAQVSEDDGSMLVRLASGKTQRLPQVSDVSGNITWNTEGPSLCENVKGLCVFSGSGEDRMFLFIFVTAGEEPFSCESFD